ncbi:hypothetical protein SAMN05216223_12569 [Actinacidiphila yanglinensis]|uniref:Penicillinase repressor n=1 Tax=Actinacidiphila yanglinensis TaxID=310779 RepID=A0A1H6E385_9ACTN|nr:BlaI/MecI/CopY family transcriptional regulator [Actinacidiphila yanglinensis]SEG92158.1 hypothetical protein SAMN05216223_12569 [Actinacidiphila yanglinensis]
MTSQSTATLRSRYVEQAASDLEEIRRQQQELTERIRVLQQEEALLVDILTLAERTPSEEASPLPEQAQDEPTLAPARSSAAGAPRAAGGRATGSGATRGRAAGGSAGKKGRQPLLGDLLMELLGSHDEPRLAKELRDELMEQHPDREPTPQVVRNTLESLVAKGRIRRHRQQRSVMYSLVQSAKPAAAKS